MLLLAHTYTHTQFTALTYLNLAKPEVNLPAVVAVAEVFGFRNVVFAPSVGNKYASSTFPGLTDALFEISRDPDKEAGWQEVSKQLAVITYFIETAAVSLQKPTEL